MTASQWQPVLDWEELRYWTAGISRGQEEFGKKEGLEEEEEAPPFEVIHVCVSVCVHAFVRACTH